MSTEGETITIQVPNNFPSDSLVSVVGSDGLTYAVRLPKDAVPGSKINVLIPTRVSVDSTDRSTAQNNYTPSQITIGAAAAAGAGPPGAKNQGRLLQKAGPRRAAF